MLVHDNGEPVVELYGHWKSFASKSKITTDIPCCYPGPTIAFNVRDCDGSPIGYDEVSRLATLNCPPISLRTGCFCNPGACQDAIPLTNADVLKNYASGHVCGDRRGVLNLKPTGAIRVSFGKESIWEDMDALATFIEKVFVSQKVLVSMDKPECNVSDTSIAMKIGSLFIFPIKGCAATRVKQWPVSQHYIVLFCLKIYAQS